MSVVNMVLGMSFAANRERSSSDHSPFGLKYQEDCYVS